MSGHYICAQSGVFEIIKNGSCDIRLLIRLGFVGIPKKDTLATKYGPGRSLYLVYVPGAMLLHKLAAASY